MSTPGTPVPLDDTRYSGPIGGIVIPGLTGIAASGLLVAAWAVDPLFGPVFLLGGALIVGLVIGNPGNEAVLLAGILLPGGLLLAFADTDGCAARMGLVLIVNVAIGIVMMFLGLTFGIILGRRVGIQPARRPVAVGILAAAAVLAAWAWVVLGSSLASGTVC